MARSTPSSSSPGPVVASSAVRFAEAARVIGRTLGRLDLAVPVFRSPPRLPGRDRTVRRRPTGGMVVAVRLNGRPFEAVLADLVEGACVANAVSIDESGAVRAQLWEALGEAGQLAHITGDGGLRAA